MKTEIKLKPSPWIWLKRFVFPVGKLFTTVKFLPSSYQGELPGKWESKEIESWSQFEAFEFFTTSETLMETRGTLLFVRKIFSMSPVFSGHVLCILGRRCLIFHKKFELFRYFVAVRPRRAMRKKYSRKVNKEKTWPNKTFIYLYTVGQMYCTILNLVQQGHGWMKIFPQFSPIIVMCWQLPISAGYTAYTVGPCFQWVAR